MIRSRSLSPATLRATLFALLAAAAAIAPTPPAEAQEPSLQALPELRFEGVGAEVEARLEQARSRLEGLVAEPASDPVDLGTAFGELGELAYAYRLDELAEAAIANAAALLPADFRWPYFLGTLYQKSRRLDEAIAAFDRALALEPDNPAALMRKGQVLLLQREPAAARRIFEQVADAEGYEAAALYGIGQTDAAIGDFGSAIDRFQRVLELQPSATGVHQPLGLAYRELGNLEAARRHLGQAGSGELIFPDPLIASLGEETALSHAFRGAQQLEAGDLAAARDSYRKAAEENPGNATYRKVLASILGQTGDVAGSIREWREAVRLAPSDGMAKLRLAVALVSGGGLSAEALDLYRAATELAPDSEETRVAYGGALLTAGRAAEAVEQFAAARSIDPADPEIRLRLARALVQSGEIERAEEELAPLVAPGSANLEALMVLGSARLAAGDAAAAAETYRRILAQGGPPKLVGIAHLQLGKLLLEESPEQSVPELEQAVAKLPRSGEARLVLAAALERMDRGAEAVALREEASELAGDRPLAAAIPETAAAGPAPGSVEETIGRAADLASGGEVGAAIEFLEAALGGAAEPAARATLLYNLAVLHQQTGDDGRAIERFRSALEESPDAIAARLGLAALLGKRGELSEAAEQFARILELDPKNVEAHRGRVTALLTAGRWGDARSALEEGLEQLPGAHFLGLTLARLLAGAPDPTVRDSQAAIDLSRTLYEADKTVEACEVVALTLAAAGRLDEAVVWQERALRQAEEEGQPAEVVSRLAATLDRYRHAS